MKNFIIRLKAKIRNYAPITEKVFKIIMDGFWWPPIALTAAAIYWASVAAKLPKPSSQSTGDYGTYGDSFGQLTSLFTALGFGGLIITLMLQQRQIRNQEIEAERNQQKQEKARYEEILFKLLDIYRLTLTEVKAGNESGRNVLISAIARVDKCLKEEKVNNFSREIQGRWDSGTLTEVDHSIIDYLHFRNFKIVGTEIQVQLRLTETFEVLLAHMVSGTPNHLLNTSYKDLVFAQITQFESRYFFLVALSHPSRRKLRELLDASGFLDHFSRSQTYLLHREMYREYWGTEITEREYPSSMPISKRKIRKAMKAWKAVGGTPLQTYESMGVRKSRENNNKGRLVLSNPPPDN